MEQGNELGFAARSEAWTLRQERVNYNATSAMLTSWKKTEELAYLSEVSSVPLQQTLRHLQMAFTNFFGKRAKYPAFKSRKKSRRSAEYTTSGFRYHGSSPSRRCANRSASCGPVPFPKGHPRPP